MYNKVAYSKEGKQILDLFDSMPSWDRIELLNYIAFHKLEYGEYYDTFIKDTEYDYTANEEQVDIVAEIINKGMEDDALEAIDDEKIVNYICDNEMIGEVLDTELDEGKIADALNELSSLKLYSVLNNLAIRTNKVELDAKLLKA